MAKKAEPFMAQARALREGESISRSFRIPVTEAKPKRVNNQMSRMRNNMNQTANRLRESGSGQYRVDSGMFVTHDGEALVLTVLLTCMEHEEADI